jgi:LmbE family N-acetylglucosaminyl deacetylase
MGRARLRGFRVVLFAVFSPLLIVSRLHSQQLGPSTGGIVAIDEGLRFLGHHKRVLMIGAHPDDEDTELLTVLVRKLGAEAAYLALTRGEGGQNLIGPELGEGLGVLRTEELLGARELDGARQFFTRAFDFGYSKGLPDTWAHWPQDSILKDVVRIVRKFRPQVLITVFSGTVRDGHGQHQAAGWAAREAFAAAGDPSRFPELVVEEGLIPWTPLRLFQNARFDTSGATVRMESGEIDPAVGQSYLQIAMRGRSRHRSQDMGSLQPIGPSSVNLTLVDDRTATAEEGLFSGIDTTLASLAADATRASALLRIGAALRDLTPWDLGSLPRLRNEFERLMNDGTIDGGSGWSPAAADQLRRMDALLFTASGVLCDALSETERLTPGSTVVVTLSCWNASPRPVEVRGALFLLGDPVGEFGPLNVAVGTVATRELRVSVPASARSTTPYFLAAPKAEGMAFYQWPTDMVAVRGEPFAPPPLLADFQVRGGGAVRREVVFRYRDQAIGEVRRPAMIVPRVALELSPSSNLWSVDRRVAHGFAVTVRMLGGDSISGHVGLEVPNGWEVGEPQRVVLAQRQNERRFSFEVRPSTDARPGTYEIRAFVRDASGQRYTETVSQVAYSHTRPRQLVGRAHAAVHLGRVSTDGIGRIAYIRGAADQIPEALHSLGVMVDLLDPDSLAGTDLASYSAVVVGPRAYETEPGLREWSAKLLDYSRGGGTVVVQYQQQEYFRGEYAPFPLSLSASPGGAPSFRTPAPRVADETVSVKLLDPKHPLFQQPNRIGPEDWEGWVQERGLYFAGSWSDEWHPVLEMADPGEDPQQGALLVAKVGSGVYVYSALSFFRELPAGVPGAARLFLNLITLRGGLVP